MNCWKWCLRLLYSWGSAVHSLLLLLSDHFLPQRPFDSSPSPIPQSCFPAFLSTVVVLAWEAVVSQQYQEAKQRISLLSCIGCHCLGDILFITHLWCLFPLSGCSALHWLIPNVSWFPPDPVALISSGFGTCCFPSPVALSAAMSLPNTVGQCQRDLIHQRHLLRTCEEASLCLVDLESLQPPEVLAWLPSCEGKEDGE